MILRRLRSAVGILLTGFSVAALSADDTIELGIANAQQDCAEIALPNAMARPPGFDLDAHLARVEADRLSWSRRLWTATGSSILASRLDAATDDLDRACLRQLLLESRRRQAVTWAEATSRP